MKHLMLPAAMCSMLAFASAPPVSAQTPNGAALCEETAGAAPDYQCCRFCGSLVALDAGTGKQI